jgi:hypothetical protein
MNKAVIHPRIVALHWLCGYRAFTVASCAKGWRDNHDLILHTSVYFMWYRTYASELYRQLSQVDLTRSVYKTSHVTLRCQGFNQITFMDTRIVGVGMRLASLLWERVYRPLLSKWCLLLWDWPVPDLMWVVPTTLMVSTSSTFCKSFCWPKILCYSFRLIFQIYGFTH